VSVLSGLAKPIIAAPMAGGPSTPDLVAAVSGAGGLGFLAAGYLPAERIGTDTAATRALTDAPIGMNVFVPDPRPVDLAAVQAYAEVLGPESERYAVALGTPAGGDDGYEDKLAALLTESVAVVSFAFGLPDETVVRALQERGSEVWVTVTEPGAAAAAAARGVDALVLQGTEAGAHRGGADDGDDLALLPLLRLVATSVNLPLVAAGGIADGAGIAAVLAAGATAAMLGTAFLRTPEAGTTAMHAAALSGGRPTRLTRAFTGRRARALVNDFVSRYDDVAPAGYPQVHQVTAPLRAAARAAGDPEAAHLWAGQAYPLARALPAAELVEVLDRDWRAALASAAAR
jgi:nitronate monooxygenase